MPEKYLQGLVLVVNRPNVSNFFIKTIFYIFYLLWFRLCPRLFEQYLIRLHWDADCKPT